MDSQKVTPEEQNKLGWGPSFPSPDEIANAVANKIIGPVVSNVGQEISKVGQASSTEITKLVGDLGELRQVIDSVLAKLAVPSIPTLNPLLNPSAINKFVSPISSSVDLFDLTIITKLMDLPSNIGMKPLPKEYVIDLLTAVGDFLDELELVANKVLKEIDLPTISIVKNAISSQKEFIKNIDNDMWVLFKYPPDLFDFAKTGEMIGSYTEKFKDAIENPNPKVALKVVLSVAGLLLGWIASILSWISSTFPLTITVGADGGAAAGINVTGAIRLSAINVGNGVIGGIGAIFKGVSELCSTINTVIQQLNQ